MSGWDQEYDVTDTRQHLNELPMINQCTGTLGLWKREIILQRACEVDGYGNVTVTDGYKEELIDTLDSKVWCSNHGVLSVEQFEFHGISEDWEEV